VTIAEDFLVIFLAIKEHLVLKSLLSALHESVLKREQFGFKVHARSSHIFMVTVSLEEAPFHVSRVVFVLLTKCFVLVFGVLDLSIEDELLATGLEPQLV
jgi:hypothetical protein